MTSAREYIGSLSVYLCYVTELLAFSFLGRPIATDVQRDVHVWFHINSNISK